MPGRTRSLGAAGERADTARDSATLATATTRREAADLLAELGVEGRLAEVMLHRTAPARHAWRVERARDAALAAALAWRAPYAPEGALIDYQRDNQVLARFVFALDAVGVGPTGRASERHPAFCGLGKGRKQATDGPAWDAAIDEAARDLPSLVVLPVQHEGGSFGVRLYRTGPRVAGANPGTAVEAGTDTDLLPWRWLRRFAEESVASLTIGAYADPTPLPELGGTVAQWAALWQVAHRAIVLDIFGGRVADLAPGEDPLQVWRESVHLDWADIHGLAGDGLVMVEGVQFRLVTWDGHVRADIHQAMPVWPPDGPTTVPPVTPMDDWVAELVAADAPA